MERQNNLQIPNGEYNKEGLKSTLDIQNIHKIIICVALRVHILCKVTQSLTSHSI